MSRVRWVPFINETPIWDWKSNDYRIQPEPREFFLMRKGTGIHSKHFTPRFYTKGHANGCPPSDSSEFDEIIHVLEVIK